MELNYIDPTTEAVSPITQENIEENTYKPSNPEKVDALYLELIAGLEAGGGDHGGNNSN